MAVLSFALYVIGLCLMPSCLRAGEVATTVDTRSIRYPSMFVGQVWVKSGEPLPSAHNGGNGRIAAGNGENASSSLKTEPHGNAAKVEKNLAPAAPKSSAESKEGSPPDAETIKKLKARRLKNLQALEKRKAKKTAANPALMVAAGKEEVKTPEGIMKIKGSALSLALQAAGTEKAKEKPSEGKTLQTKMAAASRAAGMAISGNGSPGKKWHHKQDLYDVECGQRLARVAATYYFDRNETLVGSKIYPDDQWYHIYPGSLEEKLFINVCHPTIPTVRRWPEIKGRL